MELPEKLIKLFTYRDDLVLDPFMGSGSTLIAAARLGRRYVGYELDAAYVQIARERVASEAGLIETTVASPRAGVSTANAAEQVVADAGNPRQPDHILLMFWQGSAPPLPGPTEGWLILAQAARAGT